MSHTGTVMPTQFSNQTTTSIEIVFNTTLNTNNSFWFFVSDQNGSYNISVPEVIECKPLPQSISIVRQTTDPNYNTFVMFRVGFDVDLTQVNSLPYPLSCITNTSLYACYHSSIRGKDFEYAVYASNVYDNYTLSYYDSVTVTMTLPFKSVTYQVETVVGSPVTMFVSDEQIQNPIVNVYPPSVPGKSWYIPPGQYGSPTISVQVKNAQEKTYLTTSMIMNSYFPLLGNKSDATYFYKDLSSGSANKTVAQLNQQLTTISTILFNYTTEPNQNIKFTCNNISDPNFYSLLQIVGNQIKDFSSVLYSSRTQFKSEYPFGYTFYDHQLNGTNPYTNTKLEYKVTLSAPEGTKEISLYITNRKEYSFITKLLNSYTQDKTPPKIVDLQIYPLTASSLLVVLNATDDLSGVEYLKSATQIYLVKYLVRGNSLDGLFVFQLEEMLTDTLVLTLFDFAGNSVDYDRFFIDINFGKSAWNSPLIYKYLPSNVTYWKLFPEVLDTSNGPVNATLFVNFTTVDTSMEYFYFSSNFLPLSLTFGLYYTISPFYWDYTNKLFRSDFQIPGKSLNGSFYSGLTEHLTSIHMDAYWGVQLIPNAYSSYTDKLPPVVTNWNVFPSPNVFISANQSKTTIGFNVTILDQPNGLKEGEIQFISNIDGLPYIFQFNDTTRIAGDIYNGTYRFTIDILNGTCVNQTFYLNSLVLSDIYGAKSDYPPISSINPMYLIPEITLNQMVTITCEQEPVDLVLPYIANFSFSPKSIDFRSNNRNITFTLTTRDDESGLSPRHNPVIFLAGLLGDSLLRIDYTSKTIHNTSSTTYQYSTTLPYAFSPQNVLVSVYGIVDNYLNLKGYSSLDLKNTSWDYYILSQFVSSNPPPIITNSTRLYQHGGKLTLFGRGFGIDLNNTSSFVDYQDGKGFIQVPTLYTKYLSTIIQVDQINTKFIIVKIQVISQDTNEFRIDRTEYQPVFNFNGEAPPEPPKPISCPNNCSGNGNCTFNGCVCQDPWYGPSCSTKTIIVPPPITNTSDPVIIIDTGGSGGNSTSGNSTTSGGSTTGGDSSSNSGIEVKSIISIYSLREVTLDGQKVNEFFPSNWTFNNETNIDGSNGLKFHYSSKLKDRDTIFNVTIQYFTNQSTIEFAGQLITLPPYSTKMSMSLDGYKFNSYLNNLQIIMNIELMTLNQGIQCISKQYGLGGGNIQDLQWMKLNIDDKSLYGNFIRRGIIDGRVTSIKNSLLDNSFNIGKSEQSQQTYIGINIPTYRTSAVIDPDFSHLLNVGGDSYNDDDCAQSSEDKILKTGAIVGIVVGGVIVLALIIGITLYIAQKRREINSSKDMSAKLKRLSQK